MSNEYQPKRAAAPAPAPEKKPKKEKKKMSKKKKTVLIILSVILALLLAVSGFAVWFVNSKLNKIDYVDEPTELNTDQSFVEDENLDFAEIDDATGTDFKSILKNWATNGGDKMKNKDVINVLLIGSDASATEPGRSHITDKGNTDVMMVMSIDKANKTLKLVSFMRDSYTYMDGFDRYAKLNAACANGGAEYLMETIENDYKFEIDGYAMVDFDSFKQVIDILGGVNVTVPKYVADFLNKGEAKKFPLPYGENVKLSGEQALAFCRVRYSDANGDVSRVARQRQVITSLIDKCKNASANEINNVLDTILMNIRTNIPKKKIVSYMTQALTNGWATYELTQATMPTPDACWGYQGKQTKGNWVWIVDYPQAAHNLQMYLYGETNIHLEEDRKTAISVMGGRVIEGKTEW